MRISTREKKAKIMETDGTNDFFDKVKKAKAERKKRNDIKKYLVVKYINGDTLVSANKSELKASARREYEYCSINDLRELLKFNRSEFCVWDAWGKRRFEIVDELEIYPLSEDLVDDFIEMYEEEDVLDAHRELCKEKNEEAKLKRVA